MQTQYVSCPSCRTQNLGPGGRCTNCGTVLPVTAPIQPYGAYAPKPPGADKKVAAGVCALLLGGFGVHKFILGYTTEGLIMLFANILGLIFLCGIPSIVIAVIAIIEGITYLTKSDEEFSQTYIIGRKGWF